MAEKRSEKAMDFMIKHADKIPEPPVSTQFTRMSSSVGMVVYPWLVSHAFGLVNYSSGLSYGYDELAVLSLNVVWTFFVVERFRPLSAVADWLDMWIWKIDTMLYKIIDRFFNLEEE